MLKEAALERNAEHAFPLDRQNPGPLAGSSSTLSARCTCSSTRVRYSRLRSWERALRLIMVRAFRCEECRTRFFRFVPVLKWGSPHWATVEARQLKEKLNVEQSIKELNLRKRRLFEEASREILDRLATSTGHAVALFNKEFRRNREIALEFREIQDGFILEKHFDPSVLAEVRLNTRDRTVRFSIKREGSTQLFKKAMRFDNDDRISFEDAHGYVSAEDASIALFQYVLDKKSNHSAWFRPDCSDGTKAR